MRSSKRVGRETCSYVFVMRVFSRNGANEYVYGGAGGGNSCQGGVDGGSSVNTKEGAASTAIIIMQ